MSHMSRQIELPDHTYEALLRAANERGVTPAEWIASILAGAEPPFAGARIRRNRISDYTAAAYNPEIDADLIREHEARFRHA